MQRKVPLRWRRVAAAILFSVVGSLPLPVAGEHGLSASGAWIREAPPGVAMLAGYFVLQNQGETSVALVGAESARFGAVEMHETRLQQGVARMRRLERVEIQPGETVKFAPGGRHLMLFDPLEPLRAGDCVLLTLVLDGGDEIDVRFDVRRK